MRVSRVFFLKSDMDAYVSVAHPVRICQYSEPDPDLAILRNRKDEYVTRHPGPKDTLVVIEVADTRLEYNRNFKVNLYAQASIPETWIMNLVDDCIESFTGPSPDGYANHTVYQRGDRISPSTLPEVEFAVEDLLPPVVEQPEKA